MSVACDVLAALGLCLVAAGLAWLWHPGAGLVALGAGLLALGLWGASRAPAPPPPPPPEEE